MFDEHRYRTDEAGLNELEFYIVLVKPTDDNVASTHPRLALKDRVIASTSAPKRLAATRSMPLSILNARSWLFFHGHRRGTTQTRWSRPPAQGPHTGPIVSAVTVRQWDDLGYIDKHRELERRYANYHYLPLPTREPDIEKRYIQSLITDDVFANELGIQLDPETSHVFLCGNPAMIGLPG
ncbi:MAG: hypothetical protein R2706_15045 [Acidimicrobiales bacterium]